MCMPNQKNIVDVNLHDFENVVIKASFEQPVLVDFWADWCGPCLVIAPIMEKVMAELEGKALLAKLEVDEGDNMKLAGQYRVRGFPTIILFEKGKEVSRFSGAKTQSFIESFLQEHSDLYSL